MTRTLISCCVALLLSPAVALADTRIDERHTLAAGGRIELSNVAGKVTVRGWDRNDVQLTGTLSDGLQLRQEKSANRVRWEIEYPRRSNNGGATLVLNVPRSVELLLSTVSASQDISGIDVRRLQADTVSGSLSAAGRSGDSKLNTVSGSVSARLQTPKLDSDDLRVLAEIDQMREDLRIRVRARPHWTGQLRRQLTAAAIQGSNTIEKITVGMSDARAAVEGQPMSVDVTDDTQKAILGYRDALTYVQQAPHIADFEYHRSLLSRCIS